MTDDFSCVLYFQIIIMSSFQGRKIEEPQLKSFGSIPTAHYGHSLAGKLILICINIFWTRFTQGGP